MKEITLETIREATEAIFGATFRKNFKKEEKINLIITTGSYICFDVSTTKTTFHIGITGFKNMVKNNLINIKSSQVLLNGDLMEGNDRENIIKYIENL